MLASLRPATYDLDVDPKALVSTVSAVRLTLMLLR